MQRLLFRSIFVLLTLAIGAPAQEDSVSLENKEVSAEHWVKMTDSQRYSERLLAKQQILAMGEEAIPAIVQYLPQASLEAANSLIYILTEMKPEGINATSKSALSALQELSKDRWTLAGSLAHRSLQSLADRLREEAIQSLREVNASLQFESIQIVGYPNPELHVRIDDQFLGKAADLDRLQYLTDIEFASLSGDKITASVLKQIAKMPHLKFLQLKKVRLDEDRLRALELFRPLDTLEVVYCKIDPDVVARFAGMNGLSQLALFGTGIPSIAVEQLRTLTPQMEIVYHGGGFLGIRSRDDNNGVTVVEAVPYGAADRAGIVPGDRLTHVNQVPLSKFEDLRAELSKFAPGETVKVTVERPSLPSQPKIELEIVLGERG